MEKFVIRTVNAVYAKIANLRISLLPRFQRLTSPMLPDWNIFKMMNIVAQFAEQKKRRLIINLKCALCIDKTFLNYQTIIYIQYIKIKKSHLSCKINKLEINTFYHWA